MKNKLLIVIFLLFANGKFTFSQSYTDFNLSGYCTVMQSAMFDSIQNIWNTDNLIHNRLNIGYFPYSWLSVNLQLRNRFIYGTSLLSDGYADFIGTDNGVCDLSFNIFNETSFLLNTAIDRFYCNITVGNFEALVGRQRVNWGKTYVWNPNDIFNTYSFFDFDYVERPGSDAVRLNYYTGYASSIEYVFKVEKDAEITTAAIGKFNKWNTDFQIFTGLLKQKDWVFGGGFSGDFKGLSIGGEVTYFKPLSNSSNKKLVLASLSADYLFSNQLMLRFETLLSSKVDESISSFSDYYYGANSVRNLAFTQYSFFGNISYPFTPLFNAGFSTISYPEIKGFFLGPSFTFSLTQFIDMSLNIQTFLGEFPEPTSGLVKKQQLTYAFFGLKANF